MSQGPVLNSAQRLKETCRLIRLARSYWDAHNNLACRTARGQALALYETLDAAERQAIPQELRVWLRYRSEKYFGNGKGNGAKGNSKTRQSPAPAKGKVAEAEPAALSRRALRWQENHPQ